MVTYVLKLAQQSPRPRLLSAPLSLIRGRALGRNNGIEMDWVGTAAVSGTDLQQSSILAALICFAVWYLKENLTLYDKGYPLFRVFPFSRPLSIKFTPLN